MYILLDLPDHPDSACQTRIASRDAPGFRYDDSEGVGVYTHILPSRVRCRDAHASYGQSIIYYDSRAAAHAQQSSARNWATILYGLQTRGDAADTKTIVLVQRIRVGKGASREQQSQRKKHRGRHAELYSKTQVVPRIQNQRIGHERTSRRSATSNERWGARTARSKIREHSMRRDEGEMSLGVCVVGERSGLRRTIREITIEKKTRKQGFCERDNYAKTSEPKRDQIGSL
ncbi:hypothetical protein C8Q76DRAFT_93792 [Earliella scabrosa]|nr:hypothetical protein C8Q76DRAFT_93792 [Earliella scabrosa]